MADIHEETQAKIRRSLGIEFAQMEDTFDDTAAQRKLLTDKLVNVASKIRIVDESDDGSFATVREDTGFAMSVVTGALKALESTEKAKATAINLKLRHSEAEAASAAAHADRISVVLEATRPGNLAKHKFDPAVLEHTLETMFDDKIKPFELKTNPSDLDSDE